MPYARRRRLRAGGPLLFSAAAMLSLPALAQAPAADTGIALPEVNVSAGLPRAHAPVHGFVAETAATATKTNTPIIETPQSISVITRDQIEAQASQNLNAALRFTPGVAVETRGVVSRLDQFSVRGFSAPQFLDGMRTFGGRDANPSVDPYRLERIDVLRGPASVMFGQAGPGGLVNLVSKRPTDIASREVMLQGGTFGTFRAGADFSGALNESRTVLGRIIGSYSRSDTQIDGPREERYLIAPSITFRPTTDTTITFLGLYQRDPWGGTYGGIPATGSVLPNRNGRIPTNFWDGDSFDRLDRTQYQIGYLAEHRLNNAITLRQNFRYSRSEGTYSTLYGNSPANLMPDQRTLTRSIGRTRATFDSVTLDNQIEGRFTTGPVRHTLLGGVDFYNVDSDTYASPFVTAGVPTQDIFRPVFNRSMPAIDYSTRTRQNQNAVGLYAQDQIRVGPFAIQLGGRYDWYNSDSRVATLATGRETRNQLETGAFTGRAGIVYLTDFGLAPYYSYTESFEPQSGTFSPARGGGPFDPTTGQQHELGVRYQPPGTNAMISAALFDIRRQNVTTTDPNDSRYSVQTGEVRTRGLELEARASLALGLDVIASYTYMDAEVTNSNSNVSVNRGIIGNPTSTRAERGRTPVAVPRHMGSVWGNYTFQEGSPVAGLGIGAGVRYIGATWGDTANTLRVPDYTLVDLMARYDLGRLSPNLQGATLQVNINNLLDKEYVSSCNSYAWCWYGFRRSVIATLRHRF